MHYLSSNFNLLSSNINWNLLKHKKKITIDDKYNNILLSLNNNKILNTNKHNRRIFYLIKLFSNILILNYLLFN